MIKDAGKFDRLWENGTISEDGSRFTFENRGGDFFQLDTRTGRDFSFDRKFILQTISTDDPKDAPKQPINIIDVESGRILQTFSGFNRVSNAHFGNDGRHVLITTVNQGAWLETRITIETVCGVCNLFS